MGEKRDNIEVRLNRDGSVDEIVIEDPRTGKCLFHMEQMDSHYYWMRAYGITQDLVAHIGATIHTDETPIARPKVCSDFEWEDSTNESECGEKFATPAAERREKVAEIINRFGVSCVLQEIAGILRQGRKAEHEQALIAEIDNACTKFIVGDRALMDARIAEKFGKDE